MKRNKQLKIVNVECAMDGTLWYITYTDGNKKYRFSIYPTMEFKAIKREIQYNYKVQTFQRDGQWLVGKKIPVKGVFHK